MAEDQQSTEQANANANASANAEASTDQQGVEQQSAQPSGERSHEPEPKWSDNDLDKFKGEARDEGRQAAVNSLLSEIGLEDTDSLKSIVSSYNEQQEANKSELEKLQEQSSTLEQERDSYAEALMQMSLENDLRSKLTEAGARQDRLDTIMRLVDEESIDVDDEGNFSGLDEAVNAAKESAPELFGGSGQSRRAPSVQSSGSQGSSLSGIDAKIEDARNKGDKSGVIRAMREKLRNQPEAS